VTPLFSVQDKLSAQPSQPTLVQESSQSHAAFERGLQQLKNRNYQGAIAEFNQAIQSDQAFKEAYSGRGFAYLQLGQLQNAIDSYQQIIKLDPHAAMGYSGLALVRDRLGDYDQSRSDTSRGASLLSRQITRHLYQSELSMLELEASTAGKTPKSEFWALIDRGYQQLNRKNYQGAVTLFSQATKLAPRNSARPFIDRGVAYFWLNDYRSAIEDFSTAIRANPYFIKAYQYRARAYQQIGRSQAAQADFSKAIELARQFGSASLYQELVSQQQQARQP
jgi:tetratricopeptide (TPR) repeat protein